MAKKISKKIAILGIDLQNDFTLPTGALYVNGAKDDMYRIAQFIEEKSKKINKIFLTMDAHNPIHVAHPDFWGDGDGNHPTPFSTIRLKDVVENIWFSRYYPKSDIYEYLEELEKNGDINVIWNPHCIEGTTGYAINDIIMKTIIEWVKETVYSEYQLIPKGQNSLTEMFSVFKASVIDKDDKRTHLNTKLGNELNTFDELIILGEAADYCVANSLNDILEYNLVDPTKIIVFTDCMSWINPDNEVAKNIYKKALDKGVKFMESIEYA